MAERREKSTPPGPAPELAAAMAETRIYRELLEEVLGTFGKQAWTDGMYASVSERAYRKWLERAGMKEVRR